MSSEQPVINEKGIVALVHILGSFLSFIPSLCTLFLINNLSEKSKSSIKIALNYQLTVILCLLILFVGMQLFGMFGFILFFVSALFWLAYSIIIVANFFISIIAGMSYYNTESVKYPLFFEFVK